MWKKMPSGEQQAIVCNMYVLTHVSIACSMKRKSVGVNNQQNIYQQWCIDSTCHISWSNRIETREYKVYVLVSERPFGWCLTFLALVIEWYLIIISWCGSGEVIVFAFPKPYLSERGNGVFCIFLQYLFSCLSVDFCSRSDLTQLSFIAKAFNSIIYIYGKLNPRKI